MDDECSFLLAICFILVFIPTIGRLLACCCLRAPRNTQSAPVNHTNVNRNVILEASAAAAGAAAGAAAVVELMRASGTRAHNGNDGVGDFERGTGGDVNGGGGRVAGETTGTSPSVAQRGNSNGGAVQVEGAAVEGSDGAKE